MRIATVVLLGFALPVSAQSGFGGSIGATSDYVFRGISQSREEPALQADAHYASPRGWAIGVWGSTVEINGWDGRTAELDAYLNYRWQISDAWTTSIAGTYYAYPWNDEPSRYEYAELAATFGYRNFAFVTVAWSPEVSRYYSRGYVLEGESLAYEAALALPLPRSLTANIGAGYYDLHSVTGSGYAYWNAGLSYQLKSWRADVAYFGTSSHADHIYTSEFADDRVAISLFWQF